MYQTNMYEGMLAETVSITEREGRRHQRLLCTAPGRRAVSWHGLDSSFTRLG